ncbi:sensor histidine kinase [Curvibacter gracilis]|uniref:sensor histidine kinase n=1 Tax=Curvibacter gracilis TaxID=230310 RepID=UPI000482D591|nr:GAF domain-containing sensor histidine kinase [Curvibacter gracilis]
MITRATRRALNRASLVQALDRVARSLQSHWCVLDEQGERIAGSVDGPGSLAATLPTSLLDWPRVPLACLQPERLCLAAPVHAQTLADVLTGLWMQEEERRLLVEEALAKYREINLLFRVHEVIHHNMPAREVLQALRQEAARLIPALPLEVLLLSNDTGLLAQGLGPEQGLYTPTAAPWGGEVAQRACAIRQADIVNAAEAAPGAPGMASLMVAPMVTPRAELGALLVGSREPVVFQANHLKLLVTLAAHGAVVLENALLTDQLRGALDRAESANRSKNAFLRNMGHELRTPMSAILGFSDLLALRLQDPEGQEFARSIQQSGRHLHGMLNDILEISRGEDDGPRQRTAFSVVDLLQATASAEGAAARAKGLVLHTVIGPGLEEAVQGEFGRLRQVLRHLLANAVKFSSQGQITLSASLHEGLLGTPGLEFSVSDQGEGISDEHLARIFASFEQGDGERGRRHEGVGLGLTVCKYLVERMGGELGVDSVRGQGSRFWFRVGVDRPCCGVTT